MAMSLQERIINIRNEVQTIYNASASLFASVSVEEGVSSLFIVHGCMQLL